MSSFSENLKYNISKKGFNTVTLGELINVSAGAVGFWQKGSRFPKKAETIESLIEALNITAVDLFNNPNENKKKITIEEIKKNFDNYIDYIPNINIPPSLKQIELTKGYPTLSVNKTVTEQSMQNVNHIYIDKRMIEKTYQEEQLKAVVMVGDSMQPYLQHGDVAIYYPTPKFIAPGKYVLQTPHGLELKSVSFLRNGKMQLKSENESYPTELVETQDIDAVEILGLVVGRIVKG